MSSKEFKRSQPCRAADNKVPDQRHPTPPAVCDRTGWGSHRCSHFSTQKKRNLLRMEENNCETKSTLMTGNNRRIPSVIFSPCTSSTTRSTVWSSDNLNLFTLLVKLTADREKWQFHHKLVNSEKIKDATSWCFYRILLCRSIMKLSWNLIWILSFENGFYRRDQKVWFKGYKPEFALDLPLWLAICISILLPLWLFIPNFTQIRTNT